MNKLNGFTLIELLIAVVIVGILSMIALPAYNDYVIRGKIPDATSNLATKRVQLEQFFQDNRTYVASGATSPTTNACTADTTTSQYFDFSCPNVLTATTYTLQAVGKNSMTGFTYTIDQSNAKATTAVPSGWTTNASCWVTAKGGTC